MKLTKQMLEAFKMIIHGHDSIRQLASVLAKSENRVSEIVSELEKEGLMAKEASFELKGSRVRLKIAPTPHAAKLKELIIRYKAIDFRNVLTGAKLELLAALCLNWKDLKTASEQAGISLNTARVYMKQLGNRALIARQKRLYTLGKWPELQNFLEEFRKFSTVNGVVKWKYKDEMIFEIDDERLKKGIYTGFTRYGEYGVQVYTVRALCRFPSRKLSKEEIFVHSLFEVEDNRTLNLALTFYLKNKLREEKVEKAAIKYDLFSKFSDFKQLLSPKQDRAKLESLPLFDRKEFRRIAGMYGVKNV